MAEVKQGKWIYDDYEEELTCSVCKNKAHHISHIEDEWDEDWDGNAILYGHREVIEYVKTPYCMYCGAKMECDYE